MKTIYDNLAKEYYKRNKTNYLVQEQLLKPFIKCFKDINKKILDIGCGVGLDCKVMEDKGFYTIGIDNSQEMIKYAQKLYPEGVFYLQDIFYYDALEKFDGIILDAFIHLFPKEKARLILNKLKCITKEKALFFLSTTIHENSVEGNFTKKDYRGKYKRFRHFYTEEELISFINVLGFKIIKLYYDYDRTVNKMWINLVFKKND